MLILFPRVSESKNLSQGLPTFPITAAMHCVIPKPMTYGLRFGSNEMANHESQKLITTGIFESCSKGNISCNARLSLLSTLPS